MTRPAFHQSIYPCVLLVFLVSCSSAAGPRTGPGEAPTPPLETQFHALHGDIPDAAEWSAPPTAQTPDHVAIAIESSSCYGMCAQYTLAFNGSGLGCYCARRYIKSAGTFVGEVDPESVRSIARYAESTHLLEQPPAFFAYTTDSSSVFSFIALDDRSILVRNYDNSGPPQLWAFEQLVGNLRLEGSWKWIGDEGSCGQCLNDVLGLEWSQLGQGAK
jgi:hypothetical protein